MVPPGANTAAAGGGGDRTPLRGSLSSRKAEDGKSLEKESTTSRNSGTATTSIGTSTSTRQGLAQDDFLQKYGDNLKNLLGSKDDDESFVKKNSDSSTSLEDEKEEEEDSDDDTFVTMQEMNDCDYQEEGTSNSTHMDLPEKCADNKEMVVQESAQRFEEGKRPSLVDIGSNGSENSNHGRTTTNPSKPMNTSLRRLSRQLVKRRSSVMESMPETPAGWTVLISSLASVCLGHELHLQKKLTCPPHVFGQCRGDGDDPGAPLKKIYDKLTETPDSILARNIQPSLFVGTRGAVASTASYALKGPASTEEHITFRQVLTMSADGTRIALDWELPPQSKIDTDSAPMSKEERKQQVMTKGGIQQPVVLVLHGMNNDSSFGYVRSLMRTFTNRGWVSVGMNFRGCGGVSLATPRPYNGGYTGDIRGVVQHIESRLASSDIPLFLVGNSLSANILTKYLGEEGLSGTLPKCVAGGVALGNPLLMHVNNLGSPWKEILAMGVKKDVLLNWPSLRHMKNPGFRSAIYNVLKARNIGDVDEGFAPIMIRNEPMYPFATRIGYENAESYWTDSSSCNYIRHISVPCLQIIAGDDMLVYKSFQKKLAQCIQNPNVMCVETKCGGHLGWQESPPDSNSFGVGTSWADRATLDFFDAILKTGNFQGQQTTPDGENVQSKVNKGMDNHTLSLQTPSATSETDKQMLEAPRFRSKM